MPNLLAGNVVYQGMILSDRSSAVGIHVHDTTKQDQFLITSCMDVVRTWIIARETSRVVPIILVLLIYGFPAKSLTFPHDLLERGRSVQDVAKKV